MPRLALIVLLVAVVLAGCAAPTHIEGHKIRATAASAGALHEGAPAWFKTWWDDYLSHARRGYAVLALDRNGQGGWYVFCGTSGCRVLNHVLVQSIRDVHYKFPALERCREGIGKAGPATAPDCAIYAIRDKIVWEGPLPWEGAGQLPAGSQRHTVVGATPDISGPSFALDQLAFWRVKWSFD